MKNYNCDLCGHQVYFENTLCLSCQSPLGYLPFLDHMISLSPQAQGAQFRKCQNYTKENVCNWMLASDESDDFCLSCRLNDMIPDLSVPENRGYWYQMEVAKRRLIYSLLRLGLPIVSKKNNPQNGLSFEFIADDELPDKDETKKVIIGHSHGKITINIAEANDQFREKIRLEMNEEHRTLLGHFRHEIAHYYWLLLIENNHDLLLEFRQVFGNEENDYDLALERYYNEGPINGWSRQFVSAYASAHPWEDWAESWAYYIQMYDAVETAQSLGLAEDHLQNFETLKYQWGNLCATLNSLNRSMGLKDMNPFVWTEAGIEKLRFIHKVIFQLKERVNQ